MDNTRCINLDWFEVFCLEPIFEPRDADYFTMHNWRVQVRAYGTKVWGQMFTLFAEDDFQPLLEIRRAPLSHYNNGGILPPNSVHIRLTNRTCYRDNAATLLAQFMADYSFQFIRISRADICLDFEKFDSGDNPHSFILRYMQGVYSKINQANIHAHGTDTWERRDFNSLSWGSPTSQIGTKIYDKTMELYDPKSGTYGKPYIRQAWLNAGLVTDMQTCTKPDGKGGVYTPRIWRVEFSIKSSVKRWFVINLNGDDKKFQSVRNDIETYDSRPKLLTLFASLQQHYFHFKHFEQGVPKSRCRDKQLFDFRGEQRYYKVERDYMSAPTHTKSGFESLLTKIRQYREQQYSDEVRSACDVIIRTLEDDNVRHDLNSPFSKVELKALQAVLRERTAGSRQDPAVLLREIKTLLKINDNTLPYL